MSNWIDREGIFKARPVAWKVKTFEGKRSVAINVEFVIVAQLDGGEWIDWRDFAEHRVSGDWFVVGKEGKANQVSVTQLGESLAWGGSLRQIVNEPPPDLICQVTVKAEHYNGRDYFKATWMNPEDYVPSAAGAGEEEVDTLDMQFGAMLRAAAGGVKKPPAPKPASEPAAVPQVNTDDIPF